MNNIIENGMVMGYILTPSMDSILTFEVCSVRRFNKATESMREVMLLEAKNESGLIEVGFATTGMRL